MRVGDRVEIFGGLDEKGHPTGFPPPGLVGTCVRLFESLDLHTQAEIRLDSTLWVLFFRSNVAVLSLRHAGTSWRDDDGVVHVYLVKVVPDDGDWRGSWVRLTKPYRHLASAAIYRVIRPETE
jgi:hypothetical protein